MKKYEVTYFMYPANDVKILIYANSESEAIAFAKAHRKGSFSVEERR